MSKEKKRLKFDDISGPYFEGLEIGAVSVKWVRRTEKGDTIFKILEHEGDPLGTVKDIFNADIIKSSSYLTLTGHAARSLLSDVPYRSETECLEKALSHYDLKPDMLLSLGGENFSIYPMKDGIIKNIISTSKCAAGTGEFIVQQLQRMGLSLAEGLEASLNGEQVELATRCSVHCKSDATHKLNKGECTPGDVAKSLICDLAKKVSGMVEKTQWPVDTIVISGGVVRNKQFIKNFREFYKDSKILILDESPYLEAFGASLYSEELSKDAGVTDYSASINKTKIEFDRLKTLGTSEQLLDYRVWTDFEKNIADNGIYILGVDAGSTTTKAVLLNAVDSSLGASCYLRTLGNPITATKQCIDELIKQVGDKSISIIQAGATGSAREMVSVYLDNCLSFNEILAHARAASEEVPDVDTVFEIGGQDSKFISFLQGIPVDYAMNEGCSAGTGSFLEESASVDMRIAMKDISGIAEKSGSPIAFGERCAAFINTDLRNALQQGASQEDVVAGLVYSIADNFISRIVGTHHTGEKLLFQGGVALNRSVALAIAARMQKKIVVPPHPELMGAVGTALMAGDLLKENSADRNDYNLKELAKGEMEVKSTFKCKSCENICEIQRILIHEKTYSFGGLCSKYEMQRYGKKDVKEGRDLVAIRNKMMFEEFGPQPVNNPRGTIGLPMALSTFELFPFYTKLINELGYNVVLSKQSKEGNAKTNASICYPCEIVHGAVYDLIETGVDFILLPHFIQMEVPDGNLHSYMCPSTNTIPGIIKSAFSNISGKLLSPHIDFAKEYIDTTMRELERLGPLLGLEEGIAKSAAENAIFHFKEFRKKYRDRCKKELAEISGEPAVILAGRPYVISSPDVNLALPRKVVSRGYHVIPIDALDNPGHEWSHERDVWHFTQQISNALGHVDKTDELYICLVSCFSCGPDSEMYHFFRQKLSGQTFCYLEIDSHTAHAGFETRLGAFLDIIEQRRRKGKLLEKKLPGNKSHIDDTVTPARLSDNHDYIIDSDGRRVEFDDSRIVHIFSNFTNQMTGSMFHRIYESFGRKCRTIKETDVETLQYAKKLCSGRECIPMAAMTGAALMDIETNRDEDEISIYLTLDQEGPCQNGAWPLVWETFIKRLNLKNIISDKDLYSMDTYYGLDFDHFMKINDAIALGDLFEEARNSLTCLAGDRESALEIFESEFNQFIDCFKGTSKTLESALIKWVEAMKKIPLKASIDEIPKVLIFGGLNLVVINFPVTEYLLKLGVIPKVVDVSEGASWIVSEHIIRYGFRNNLMTPVEQYAQKPKIKHGEKAKNARKSRMILKMLDTKVIRLRSVMEKSGLMFDRYVTCQEILKAGHEYASGNGITETSGTVGRYICSSQDDIYDGLVNMGSFNCQPSLNAQAIIHPLAAQRDMPYIAIDCEGPWLSINQKRLIETLAVQAKRVRKDKLE